MIDDVCPTLQHLLSAEITNCGVVSQERLLVRPDTEREGRVLFSVCGMEDSPSVSVDTSLMIALLRFIEDRCGHDG